MNRRAFARLVLALSGLVAIATGLLLPAVMPSLAAVPAQGAAHHKPSKVTVRGPRMINPNTINSSGRARALAKHSSVTVNLTRDLTNQTVRVSWTHFTPSNLEGGFPYYQYDYTLYPVEIVECRVAHPVRVSQCWQASNYQEQFGSQSNALYDITASNGTGTVDFQVQNSLQNSWLGCNAHHACSIVVIPSQGGLPSHCANHSQDTTQSQGLQAFGGNAQGCSWAKRVVVPLTFGPVRPCAHIRNPNLRIAGSPLMNNAMSQWDTGLCRQQHPLTIAWNPSIGEPAAILETVTDGIVDVALTTRPTSNLVAGKRKYTYAPVGVTAAAMTYWFDNPNTGQPYTRVRLNPRLVAKLLSTSYTDYDLDCANSAQYCDKAVNGNPPDLFSDPEFMKLNKSVQEPHDGLAEGLADVPIVVGGQSDITYEVTRWIAANRAATAFLDGKRDHWGMHVNTHYRGITYPVESFTSRDNSFLLQAAYTPTATLGFVTSAMLQGQPPGNNGFQPITTNCPPAQQCFNALAGEPLGQRALFGITDEADAAVYRFPTAAILNHAGRYVTPTEKSMAAALRSMTTAKNGITQLVNLKSKSRAEYPLTMVVYALVPIKGVSHKKAAEIARWLDDAVGPFQRKGELPGRLPLGYLPLPAKLRAQARTVATEVLDQSGAKKSPSSSPTPSTSPSPGSGGSSNPGSGGTSPSTSPSSPAGSSTGASSSPVATPTISMVALRRPAGAGLTRYALPALLIAAGLAAVLGASIGAAGAGPGVLAWLRRRTAKLPGPLGKRG